MSQRAERTISTSKKIKIILISLLGIVFLTWMFAFQDCAMCNHFRNFNDDNLEYERTDINVETAQQMLELNSSSNFILLLDVRTQEEYDDGHIVNATLIPLADIETEDNLNYLLPYQNATVIVYCRSGNRSGQASDILLSYNFSAVYNMLGGFTSWKSAGYDYET